MLKILKYCLFLLIFLFFLIGVFLFCVNNNKVWEGILVKQLNSRFNGVVTRDVKITSVRFMWPDDLEFRGIQTELLVKKAVYIVKSDLSINTDLSQKKILFKISNASVKADTMNIDNIETQAHIFWDTRQGEAETKATTIKFGEYRLTNVQISSFYENNSLTVKAMTAEAYGGTLQAQGEMVMEQDIHYEFDATMRTLDLDRLKKANASVFSLFKGKLDAVLAVSGLGADISSLKGRLVLLPGGYVKASVLNQYIQDARLNMMLLPDKLKDALKNDIFLPVEYDTLDFESVSDRKITGIHNVWSRDYFIKIVDSPLNINLDATLGESIKRFLIQ